MILMKHVAILGRFIWQGTGGQPLANRHLVPETLSPTVLKELNPVNKYIDELGSGSFLSEAFGVFPGQVQHLNYTLVRDDVLKS